MRLNESEMSSAKKRKMIITGASGLVGSHMLRAPKLRNHFDIFAAIHTEPIELSNSSTLSLQEIHPVSLDIAGPFENIQTTISRIRPDVIINLAAMTNVDLCETERELADRLNHLFVGELARYIDENPECFLLHVSTDYVFDGEQGDYAERDEPNPLAWYGMTKHLGEKALIACRSDNWCIARTSTPYGVHEKKQSFPIFVAKNLAAGNEIGVLTDQFTSPTYCQNLAEMLYELIDVDGIARTIIHVAGSSQISRFDQALRIANQFGLDKNLIKPSTMNNMKWKAKRPRNSTLNVSVASKLLEHKPLNFDEGLYRFSDDYLKRKGDRHIEK